MFQDRNNLYLIRDNQQIVAHLTSQIHLSSVDKLHKLFENIWLDVGDVDAVPHGFLETTLEHVRKHRRLSGKDRLVATEFFLVAVVFANHKSDIVMAAIKQQVGKVFHGLVMGQLRELLFVLVEVIG